MFFNQLTHFKCKRQESDRVAKLASEYQCKPPIYYYYHCYCFQYYYCRCFLRRFLGFRIQKKKYGGFKIEVPKMSDALEWKIYSIFFVISLILISLAPTGAIILRINQFVYLLHLDRLNYLFCYGTAKTCYNDCFRHQSH